MTDLLGKNLKKKVKASISECIKQIKNYSSLNFLKTYLK